MKQIFGSAVLQIIIIVTGPHPLKLAPMVMDGGNIVLGFSGICGYIDTTCITLTIDSLHQHDQLRTF